MTQSIFRSRTAAVFLMTFCAIVWAFAYPLRITIFNALIPILGVILSCVFLREPFSVRYLMAGVIVAGGVYIVNS